MGTSFVEFNKYGFWASDSLLELWLYFLSDEVKKYPNPPDWLKKASENWRLQSMGTGTGSVYIGLDEYIDTSSRGELLRTLCLEAAKTIKGFGDHISAKTLNTLNVGSNWGKDVPVNDLLKLAVQFMRLLDGKLTSTASSPEALPNFWEVETDPDSLNISDVADTHLKSTNRISESASRIKDIPGYSPLPQPDNVFKFAEYKEYIKEANRAWGRASSAYRGHGAGWGPKDIALYGKERAILNTFLEQYIPRLPVYMLARCPICGGKVSESIDTFSFNGFGWNNIRMESSGLGWYGTTKIEDQAFHPAVSYHSDCDHTRLMLYGVNLNGHETFDHMWWNTIFIGSERPYIIPPLLQVKDTFAVLHSLPLGRVSDDEYIGRYTIYFATYFTRNQEEFDQALSPCRHPKKPMKILPYNIADYDLLPWVKNGCLYWLSSEGPNLSLNQQIETFPYENIAGRQGRWSLTRHRSKEYILRQLDTFTDGWFGY
jgi:hypothetical protein